MCSCVTKVFLLTRNLGLGRVITSILGPPNFFPVSWCSQKTTMVILHLGREREREPHIILTLYIHILLLQLVT